MDSIKDLLKNSIIRNKIKPQVEACSVLDEFKSLVKNVWGQEVLDMIEPKYVKEKILYVHCNSSAVASALHLAKKKLVEELNDKMQENIIKDIVLWQ